MTLVRKTISDMQLYTSVMSDVRSLLFSPLLIYNIIKTIIMDLLSRVYPAELKDVILKLNQLHGIKIVDNLF